MVGVKDTGTILIRGARQLLTLRGPRGVRRGADLNELSVIPDGALLIRNGIIEEVGPSRRVENLAGARDAVEINAAGRVVMPGFVDSHTHLVFAPPGTRTRTFKALCGWCAPGQPSVWRFGPALTCNPWRDMAPQRWKQRRGAGRTIARN